MPGTGLRDRHRVWVAGVALLAFVAAMLPWFVEVEKSSPRYRASGAIVPTPTGTVERIQGRSLLSEPFLASLVRMAELAQTDPTARVSRRAGTLVVEVGAEGPTPASAEAAAEAALRAAVDSFDAIAWPTGDIHVHAFGVSPAVPVGSEGLSPPLHLLFAAIASVLAAAVTHRTRRGGIGARVTSAAVEVPSIPEFAAVVAALAWRQGLHRVVLDVSDVPGVRDALSTAIVRRGLTIVNDDRADAVRVLALHRARRPEETARLARRLKADAVLEAG